jgi:hypothetical protein
MFVKKQTIHAPNGCDYTYYRLVQAYRENGQVKHRVIAELGRLTAEEAGKLARRFAEIAGNSLVTLGDVAVHGMRLFGAPLLVERVIQALGLDECLRRVTAGRRLGFDVVAVLKLLVCAHLFKDGSRSELSVWDWQQRLFWFGRRHADLGYHELLRALDVFVEAKDEVEKHLFFRLVDLFGISVDVVFYDLTSTYVEGQGVESERLQRGYSRDGRPDCKQIVIGLVVTREGFPVTCRVFDGNTVDKKTLKAMVDDLRTRFEVGRCIWVSDTGLLSAANRKLLEESGYEYILGAGNGTSKEMQAALAQTRREPDARVKAVRLWNVAGVKGQRVVVVESDPRREKTAAILERRLQKVREGFRGLEKRVAQGQCATEGAMRTAAAKVLHRSGVAKYFTYEVSDGRLQWQEDEAAVAARKQDAGKYGLVTTTDMEVSEVLGAYRTLLAAEDAFRVLKDDLELRPLWHRSDAHIEGHVQVAMWGYLVHKSVEVYLERAGVDLSVTQALGVVKDVQAVEVAAREQALWRMTQVSREAERVFQAVGIDNLKGQFEQWADGAPAYAYEPRRRECARKAPVGSPD